MRFPDFNDEWTPFFVGDIAKLGRGRVISNKEIQIQLKPLYPVYSSQTLNNGVMGYLDTFDFEGEYITWTTDGANAGTVFYRSGKFNCTNVCGILKLKSEFSHLFCALGLQKETKKFVSTNLANPKLMNNTMAKISLSLPSPAEQKKIADFFSLIDERITNLSETIKELKTQKAGLLNQLFSQKLRFPDFNDEWKETTLGEILSLAPQIPIDKPYIKDIISVKLHGKGISRTSATTLNLGATQYYLRRAGQLIYGKQNFHNGAIALIPKEYDNGITSKDIPSFVFDTTKSSPKYVLAYLLRVKYYETTEVYTTGTGSKRLKEDSFFSLPISLPSLAEQKKIADFLSLIDERIEVEEQLLKKYEEQKKYLLRQMFV